MIDTASTLRRDLTTPGATLIEQLRWQIPEAAIYQTATRELLEIAADELERLCGVLSDATNREKRLKAGLAYAFGTLVAADLGYAIEEMMRLAGRDALADSPEVPK